MRKCLKLGCERPARHPFDACSATHGADIRMARIEIAHNLEGNSVHRKGSSREDYTVEEAMAYAG